MKKLILSIVVVASSFISNAQSQLATLTAESGNRSLEQANCWAFGATSYSNLEFRINGNWSLRSNALTSTSLTACWVKSPWIKPGSGNITMKVRLENDRGTTRGLVFQYIPYDENAASSFKEGTATSFYTYNWATPLDIWVKDISVPVPTAIANSDQPYKILISYVGTGGTSRAFSDDLFIPGTYWSDPSSAYCLPLPTIKDSDSDGVADSEDAYPEDAKRAYDNFYPATGKGTIMFEDLWPTTGDYDFNDFVASFRQQVVLNSKNNVVELKLNMTVRAIGASFHNGFGIQLDGLIPKQIVSVTGANTGKTDWLNVESNGTESGQTYANIIAFDDAFRVLPSPGGSGVNVDPANPYAQPVSLELVITFDPDGDKAIKIDDFKINPYLIVNQEREREIHLPGMEPTDLANKKLFGTGQDDSNSGKDKLYKSKNNLPWAIVVPAEIPYPQTKVDFLQVYPNFGKWAETSGFSNEDWFENKKGYRNEDKMYIEK
ncbi:MAG: LruC domain-containing protein [Bacteroidia bacterium]